MRIAHINTHVSGGAGVTAKRIHLGLRELNIDSLLLTLFGKNALENHVYFRDNGFRETIRKILNSSSGERWKRMALSLIQHPNLKGRPSGFEMFSPLHHDKSDNRFALLEDRDILHLHWVNNFVDYERFFLKFNKKKFVWTLHDMNPFTGGCHHSDGCMKFESNCINCPQLQGTRDPDYSLVVQEAKMSAIANLANDQLVVVSPSEWLLQRSLRSRVLGRFRHELILNPTFNPERLRFDQKEARQKLGLPIDGKIVLFVSDNLNNPRKGIRTLLQAVKQLPEGQRPLLVGLGDTGPAYSGIEVRYPGKITDTNVMATYFNAADVFVTASVAENSPLVIIEALTCGTPVVASATGGIPELVNESNGFIFPVGDVYELANVLQRALATSFDRTEISRRATDQHALSIVCEKYTDLYRSLDIN